MGAGYVVWLTGLSGAGKSTIANLISAELKRRGEAHELLDGDEVRQNLTAGLGFSREDRDTNILRVGWVAKLLARHGVGVITAVISPYADTRERVRAEIPQFIEVFVDAPLEECAARDVKGLYARALAGDIPNFTGVSDPYEPPVRPEIHLHTDRQSPPESAAEVIRYLELHGFLSPEGAADG